MTEVEWLASGNPLQMLAHAGPDPDERRSVLSAVACLRRYWTELPDACRGWAETAEQVAEGEASSDRLSNDWELVEEQLNELDAVEAGSPEAGRFSAVLSIVCAGWMAPNGWEPGGTGWHREQAAQANLVRDIFGNPFRPVAADPSWLTPTVVDLAAAIYADRAFDRLPVLADALEEAGCDNADVLTHCRGDGPHVLGCWVLDLVLGKS